MPHPELIVFTDLDGTLLDHDSYSPAAAAPALARLRAAGVPLVLASSKTAAEIAPLRDALGFADVPAIVENGAGLLEPGESATAGGRYEALRAALDTLPADLRAGFAGFGDWGPDGIAEHTGLSPEEAARAARRQFSEPGLWTGGAAEKARFLDALAARGITAREGGRFLTLSFGGTKAARMEEILARYGHPFSVALGDAPNDVEMLERADLGIVVANPRRAPLPPLGGEEEGRIRRTTLAGPAGWNEAILQVMVERSR
ncbi:HAD-IIB family hydrolase [Actibacterium sp. MT2.3-13A]|uniref:HAD-IIB family hydrolase n=1 Tax=Actibacterium sp. MT2.3-13A TaxID=2828332 RepID=UPI001BA45181|nr:HAD-IIB family hydrolase [Actibacterium sp. MT2.3-13A]